ncbi:MAG TPA: CHRD domain-containing protein [Rhizomicrobium sp.]|jgi:hypothetical protein
MRAVILAAGVALLASQAQAQTVSLTAYLLGKYAVPATKSDAFGEGQFTYDSATGNLTYYLSYDGTAPNKIDLHGPAASGTGGPALLTFPVTASPVTGTATLTKAQADSLLAGTVYVDMHSPAYPDGEIRGQIRKE